MLPLYLLKDQFLVELCEDILICRIEDPYS